MARRKLSEKEKSELFYNEAISDREKELAKRFHERERKKHRKQRDAKRTGTTNASGFSWG